MRLTIECEEVKTAERRSPWRSKQGKWQSHSWPLL